MDQRWANYATQAKGGLPLVFEIGHGHTHLFNYCGLWLLADSNAEFLGQRPNSLQSLKH